jgi:hypothetical protein
VIRAWDCGLCSISGSIQSTRETAPRWRHRHLCRRAPSLLRRPAVSGSAGSFREFRLNACRWGTGVPAPFRPMDGDLAACLTRASARSVAPTRGSLTALSVTFGSSTVKRRPPIAAGRCHTFCVDAIGRLLACGRGFAVGHNDAELSYSEPMPVPAMAGVRVRSVAAGSRHSLALGWDKWFTRGARTSMGSWGMETRSTGRRRCWGRGWSACEASPGLRIAVLPCRSRETSSS